MREERYGGLTVRIVGGTDRQGGGDGPVTVLLHGFGAPGEDLVGLWRVLDVPSSMRFVFPEAPLSLGPGFGFGRAWWMIDIEALQLGAGRAMSDRSREVPDGLAEVRRSMVALLDDVKTELGAPRDRVVLGGFSQGAMVSCDVALHEAAGGKPLAGVVLLSGTLLAADQWTALMKQDRALHIFQSHGTADPLLPFSAAERLRELLRAAGHAVEWVSFRGGHEIPMEVLDRLGPFLNRVTGPAVAATNL